MKKNNNNKIIISIFIFLIILTLSISIIISNNTSQEMNFKIDSEKIYYEIKYLDSQIMNMINLLNNIEQDANLYIDWYKLEEQSQMLRSYWNSAILDLNYLEIDKTFLTDFGKNLDELSVTIKNKDKNNTLNNLLVLYEKIIIYSENINYYSYNTILIIKYNLLKAYSIVDSGNWTLVHEYILKSSENMSNLVNSIETNKYNKYNINQAYVSVKEMENLINVKDISIFYFKYSIAMDRIKKIGEVL